MMYGCITQFAADGNRGEQFNRSISGNESLISSVVVRSRLGRCSRCLANEVSRLSRRLSAQCLSGMFKVMSLGWYL